MEEAQKSVLVSKPHTRVPPGLLCKVIKVITGCKAGPRAARAGVTRHSLPVWRLRCDPELPPEGCRVRSPVALQGRSPGEMTGERKEVCVCASGHLSATSQKTTEQPAAAERLREERCALGARPHVGAPRGAPTRTRASCLPDRAAARGNRPCGCLVENSPRAHTRVRAQTQV